MFEMPMTELVGVFPVAGAARRRAGQRPGAWQGIVNQIGEQRASFLATVRVTSKVEAALSALASGGRRGILLRMASPSAETGAVGGGAARG